MQRMLPLAMLVLVLWVPSMWAAEPPASIDEIEKNLAERKAMLVDVREGRETAEGYVVGAVLVPLSLLEQGVQAEGFAQVLEQKLPKERVLYCYDRLGPRTSTAAGLFAKLGYEAIPLKLSYQDLVAEGFVTAKPKQ